MRDGVWTKSLEHKMQREWFCSASQMVHATRLARGSEQKDEVDEPIPRTTLEMREFIKKRLHSIMLNGEAKDVIKAGEVMAKLVGASAPEVDLRTHLATMGPEDRIAYCETLMETCAAIIKATREG